MSDFATQITLDYAKGIKIRIIEVFWITQVSDYVDSTLLV